MLNGGGAEGSVLDDSLKLLRNAELDEVTVGAGDEDVHLIGLGGDELGIKALSAEVELNTGALVDGEGGDLVLDLDLNGEGVDDLDGGDGALKDKTSSLARVDGDGVDLTLDVDDASSALVDVDGLLGLRGLDHDLLVVVLELLQSATKEKEKKKV